jgi:hypothetical protein
MHVHSIIVYNTSHFYKIMFNSTVQYMNLGPIFASTAYNSVTRLDIDPQLLTILVS